MQCTYDEIHLRFWQNSEDLRKDSAVDMSEEYRLVRTIYREINAFWIILNDKWSRQGAKYNQSKNTDINPIVHISIKEFYIME